MLTPNGFMFLVIRHFPDTPNMSFASLRLYLNERLGLSIPNGPVAQVCAEFVKALR